MSVQVRSRGRRHALAGTVITLALLTAPVASAEALGGFHTSAASVRVRAAATTASAQIGTVVAAGTAIDIECQIIAQPVTAAGFGTSSVWDKLNGYNGYISDLFVKETLYAKRDPRLPTCLTGRQSISYNPFAANYSNQCTYYAEERMRQFTGLYMPVYGNAYQWANQARAVGWSVGTTPAVNSVVVFPAGAFGSSVGHVAWVVGLGNGTLHIQDYNWNWVGAKVTDHWVSIPGGTQYIYS